MNKENFEIVKQDLYKFIEPNITTENNGVIYFNTDKSGSDNAYPEALIDRYLNASSIHSNFINLKRRLTYATGLYPVDEKDIQVVDFINKKNMIGDDINDVYLKCCLDYSIQEMAAFQVLYNASGKIAQIIHTDMSKLRSGVPDKYGIINKWFYSADWVLVNGSISFRDRRIKKQKAVPIPVFNPAKFKEEPRQIVVMKRYTTGNPIYSIPSYNAGLNAVDTDYQLSLFNLNQIKNGFLPPAIISLIGNPSAEEKANFIREFTNKQVGAKNVKALFMWLDNMENKPAFERMAADANADLFTALKDQVVQDIALAHGASIELAGIDKGGSDLGGDANKLNIARLTFIDNVIKDFQRVLVKEFNNVLRYNELGEVMVTNDPLKIAQPLPQPDDLTRDERREILYGLSPLDEPIIEEETINE